MLNQVPSIDAGHQRIVRKCVHLFCFRLRFQSIVQGPLALRLDNLLFEHSEIREFGDERLVPGGKFLGGKDKMITWDVRRAMVCCMLGKTIATKKKTTDMTTA